MKSGGLAFCLLVIFAPWTYGQRACRLDVSDKVLSTTASRNVSRQPALPGIAQGQGRREAELDQFHGFTTLRTGHRRPGSRRGFFGQSFDQPAVILFDQLADLGGRPFGRGVQETVVADPQKAGRQNVLQESPEKLAGQSRSFRIPP